MNKKTIFLITNKWKSTLALWCIFPISSVIYVILNNLGIIDKNSQVHPYIDEFYTGFIINIDKANAFFVLLLPLFFFFWLLHVMYRLKRQERVYLRSIFEWIQKPVINVLIVLSGLLVSSIFLDFFSDLDIIQSYNEAIILAVMCLFISVSLKQMSRDIFNSIITNKDT